MTYHKQLFGFPEHAKRLMYALQENVAKYERNFGPIRMPEEMNGGNNGPDGKAWNPDVTTTFQEILARLMARCGKRSRTGPSYYVIFATKALMPPL